MLSFSVTASARRSTQMLDGRESDQARPVSHGASDATAVARDLLDAWNSRDFGRFAGLLHADVQWYDPAMPQPPASGRAAVRAFAESILRAFPDFRYEILEPICAAPDGTRCAIPWRITATHLAPLVPPGFAPTGHRLRQEGIDLIDVRDGRVIRVLTCFDALAAAGQLLAVTVRPTPGTMGERLLVLCQRIMAARARRLARSRG